MTKIKTKKILNEGSSIQSNGYTNIKSDGFYKITFFLLDPANSNNVTINDIPIRSGTTSETKIVTFKSNNFDPFETDFSVYAPNNCSVYVAMYYK